MTDQRYSPVLAFVGRVGLALLFLLGATNKLINYSMTHARMEQAGLVPADVLLPLTIALEALGGVLIIVGRGRWVLGAACALAVFTLATNWFFHPFWRLDGTMQQLELSLFFKNIAITGALLYVGATENRDQVR